VLSFVYDESPKKAHMLKAGSPMKAAFRGEAFEKWLDPEGSAFLNLVY
jgi:hypothetical protein